MCRRLYLLDLPLVHENNEIVTQRKGATNSGVPFNKAATAFVTYDWRYWHRSGVTKDYCMYVRGFKPGTSEVLEMRSEADLKSWLGDTLEMFEGRGIDITGVEDMLMQNVSALTIQPGLSDAWSLIADDYICFYFRLFANAMGSEGWGWLRSVSGSIPRLLDIGAYQEAQHIPQDFSEAQRRLSTEMIKKFQELKRQGAKLVAGEVTNA
eukprot:COSAG01_NODE_22213_length_866_cov_2.022164_1_plen_208_part_10